MTKNITNPTRTVDDILEALFPRCTEPLEGFKHLSPSVSVTVARVSRTRKAVSRSGAGLLLIYPSQLQRSVSDASAFTGR